MNVWTPPSCKSQALALNYLPLATVDCRTLRPCNGPRSTDTRGLLPSHGPMLTSRTPGWAPQGSPKQRHGHHHHAPHPSGSKDQAGLLKQSLQPLWRGALGGRPTPFLPWRSPPVSAARSVLWSCMSIQMASRPMAMSAIRCPLAAAASPSKRCASSRPSGPMPSHASCRGGLAPRCRCSEARASAGRGSRPVSSWARAFPWEGRPVWSALGPVAGMGLAPPWPWPLIN